MPELVDVIIPISFNFPNMAKVLGLSFILFAGWFVNSEVSVLEYPMFTISGLLSSFGSSSLTIPFMLNSYEIPEDMYQLFLLSGIIDRRFGTLLASVNLIALTLISIRFMTEGFKIKFFDLVKSNVITIVIVLCSLFCVKMYFSYAIKDTSESRNMIHRLKVQDRVEEKVFMQLTEEEKDDEFDESLQDRIQERAVIRVGYKKQNLPFTYLTDEDELQGFDIQYAHRLANDLACRLEFIPFTNDNMDRLLDEGVFDLAMSGIPWSPELLQKHLVSEPVLTVNLGLVVKDHRKKEFSNQENRRTNKYKLAVLDQNPFIVKIARELKNITLVEIASHTEFFSEESDFDGLLISAEAGAAWTLYHPGYSLVVPKPSIHKYAISFVLSSKNASFLPFLNQWLKMQNINGFDKENYDYWILGKGADTNEKRWSIGGNVLELWDSSPEGHSSPDGHSSPEGQ